MSESGVGLEGVLFILWKGGGRALSAEEGGVGKVDPDWSAGVSGASMIGAMPPSAKY